MRVVWSQSHTKLNPQEKKVKMIDMVVVICKNGGHLAATSQRGKDFILDSEFTDDLYNTWCDKHVAVNMAVIATRDGLKVIACEDSPFEIELATQQVRYNATETPIYEYIEKLKYSGQH